MMTFDKRFFEFAGECSYLLARDFINGKFSVVVNYARARDHVVRKSITVMGGGAQFEVMPDGRVNMNGALVELPVKAGNMAIRRSGNLVIIENRCVVVTCCCRMLFTISHVLSRHPVGRPHPVCSVDCLGSQFEGRILCVVLIVSAASCV